MELCPRTLFWPHRRSFSRFQLANQLPRWGFPQPLSSNHSSAVHFPDTMDTFLFTEIEHPATAGPFICNPFPTPLETPALQTVSRDGSKQCVDLALRFAHGASVNDGISKDSLLHEPFHLTLPRSSNFVDHIVAKGPGCYLFKKDLNCAYWQIRIDPKDYMYILLENLKIKTSIFKINI